MLPARAAGTPKIDEIKPDFEIFSKQKNEWPPIPTSQILGIAPRAGPGPGPGTSKNQAQEGRTRAHRWAEVGDRSGHPQGAQEKALNLGT